MIATDLKLLQTVIKEADTVELNLQIKKHWELPKSGLNSLDPIIMKFAV